MTKIDNPYEKAQEFHAVFDPKQPSLPTAFSPETAAYRAGFKAEEIVEFLYGTANNDVVAFQKLIVELKKSVDQAVEKVQSKKQKVTDPLVDQVDALTDLLYFTYGSFSLLGVDPTEIFAIVHEANMGKVFPDGKPHYDPITNKVLKPADWAAKHAPEEKIKAEIKRQSKLKKKLK